MKVENLSLAKDCLDIQQDLKTMLERIKENSRISVCGSCIYVSNKVGGINTDKRLRDFICKFIKEEQKRINKIIKSL